MPLAPQQKASRAAVLAIAQECSPPVVSAVNTVVEFSETGLPTGAPMLPMPSCPLSFLPQQEMRPVVSMPQTKLRPLLMDEYTRPPETVTGRSLHAWLGYPQV